MSAVSSFSVPRSGVLPIAFNREKYGRELLVDAAFVSAMPKFTRTAHPHRLDFFDIVLITEGRGTFALDERVYPVAPGMVLFSLPGEVRQWRVPHLDGAVLFFAPEFFTEAFRDTRFLEQFECFHPDRPSAAVSLRAAERRRFLASFGEMERELRAARADEPHVLRAITYQLLVLLNRAYVETHGMQHDSHRAELLTRFREVVEARFASHHGVAPYAHALGVTPRYLNDRCRAAGLASAGAIVHARLALEARRLLLYTDLPIAAIGRTLGFEDPAYFARFFCRESGMSPSAYRVRRETRHASRRA